MSERDLEKPAPDSGDQQWAEDAEAPADKEPAELPLDVRRGRCRRTAARSEARRGRLPLTSEFATSQQADRRPQ